jgi:hypothetical protein
MNDTLYAAFISIMTECVNNNDGKCDDAEVCATIAAYLNMLPFTTYYGNTLWEFINDYGEDSDDRYLGRDEDGEKRYLTTNPDTNWHERIRKELVKLGHYQRHQEWWASQNPEAAAKNAEKVA